MRDPYIVLGVPRTASQPEIKKIYRKLAKELHPDRNPGNQRIADRFKEVSAAYQIVGDEKQRARFDRGEIDATGAERPRFYRPHGAAPGGGPGGASAGPDPFERFGYGAADSVGAEDLFSELFGNFRRGGRTTRRTGIDRKFSLKIGFLDAARGAKRRVTLPEGRTLDVTIPAGIVEGQQIRLKRQGEAGGDALIEVQIEPHAFFTRKGGDIHLELPVTLQEAVLGARINVPTIDGMVAMTIPKASNSGTTLRLKGRGIAERGSAERGDQYVKLKLVLPEGADAELERFVENWRKDYDVRARYVVE